MDGAGVAVKNDIGNLLFRDDIGERFCPSSKLFAVRDVGGLFGPKGTIARIKSNPPHVRASFAQHLRQAVEKRPVWPLKKEIYPVGCVQLCHHARYRPTTLPAWLTDAWGDIKACRRLF